VSDTANLGAETTAMTATSESAAAASSSGQTDITVTSTTGINAGDTVTLAAFTAGNGNYVVASILPATSMVVFDEGVTITSSGSGTVTVVAQEARQLGADLSALGVAENLTYADGTAASAIGGSDLYTKAVFNFYKEKGFGGFNQASGKQKMSVEMYYKQDITAASYDAVETVIDAVIAALP